MEEIALQNNLSPRLRITLLLWRNGADLRKLLSRSTFTSHRTALRVAGIDIALPPPRKVP